MCRWSEESRGPGRRDVGVAGIRYRAIGVVHSPYTDPRSMPIQPAGAAGVEGSVDIDPAYADGLRDLDGFSHIILLYHFDRAGPTRLVVKPFMDTVEHGVFATRAPTRPNPIGLSVVRLLEVDGNRLRIANVDILNGTPVLDIKPFVPAFDVFAVERTGWLAGAKDRVRKQRSDDRFASTDPHD